MFVGDISLINDSQSARRTPNPNVLLELGYALHALGPARVILVFNRAYGAVEELPFDLRMRRVMTYDMHDSVQERASERRALQAKFDDAIRAALAHIEAVTDSSLLSQTLEAVENLVANRVIVVRRFLGDSRERIWSIRPKPVIEWQGFQDLIDALDRTTDIVADYSRVAATVAAMGDEDTAVELHRAFGAILDAYDTPEGFSGTFYPADFDFFKFIGHELYTTLFAVLIREERWETISRLLNAGIPVRYSRTAQGPANSAFHEMSDHVFSFGQLSQERQRMSVHADILKQRHEQDPLRLLMPFDDLMGADYFLFLRGELSNEQPNTFIDWRPWTTVFMKYAPRFFHEAQHAANATRIAKALGLPDVQLLKEKLHERAGRIRQLWRNGFWNDPLRPSYIDKIGIS